MATTTTITTTYAGEKAAGYVAAALLSANTIENGGITVKPNVKFKEVLKRVSTDDILKNEICDFTATSTLTLSEKILQPETFQVNLQLCKADFRSDWDAIEMGYSAFDELPKSFADFLIGHVAAKVAAKTETNIWSGINANEGEFDGFQSLLTADAELPAAQKLTAVGGGVTPLNVVAELGSIVDALPTRLYGEEGLTLYVSSNIYRAYVRSLGGFGANGLGSAGVNAQGNNQAFGDLMFDGIPLFMCNGMSDDTSILTVKDNLFFGTGLLSDMNEVKVLDMSDLDGSQNVRVVMRMTAGVQYAFAGDVVTYGI
tara:strand:- start:52 stop:993 length:942 start_codon:yes stop_codon:yes gene_type:complete